MRWVSVICLGASTPGWQTLAVAGNFFTAQLRCKLVQHAVHVLVPDGSAKGLRARGGFEVDLTWKSGKLTAATVRNLSGTNCKVAYAGKSIDLNLAPGAAVELDGALGRK